MRIFFFFFFFNDTATTEIYTLSLHDALPIFARGADPGRMYAELFARIDGCNKGKGGSLHMIDADLGFLGANGIVGGGIPLATGAALQLKRRGTRGVAVSF